MMVTSWAIVARQGRPTALEDFTLQQQTIGYWRLSKEDANTSLPWPEENSAEDPAQQAQAIANLKTLLASSKLIRYRGASRCRLCGASNGATEIHVDHDGMSYRIPEGYLHYLTAHRVKADARLLGIRLGA